MKEILKNLVETTTLPEDSYLDQDAEILEIFVEEIEEIFVELSTLFTTWFENPSDQETLSTIRRHFHTLKGSGRMVGAKSAGELAWTVEDILNRAMSGTIPLDDKVQYFAQTVFKIYQYKLYPIFKTVQLADIDLRPLVLLGQQIQQKLSLEPALEELLELATNLTTEDGITGLEFIDERSSAVDNQAEGIETEDSEVEDNNYIEETIAIFIEEAEDHLATIDQFLKNEEEHTQDYNGLIRALHTLRGSSSMAQIEQIFEASTKVENLFKTLLQDDIVSTSNQTALLIQYAEFVRDYLHILRQGQTQKLDAIYETFNNAWNNYGFASTEIDEGVNPQGLVSKLIALNIDLLLDAEFEFEKRAKVEYPEYIQALTEQAQQLLDHTDNRAAIGIHQFTHELKLSYETLVLKPELLNLDYAYELFAQAHQEFIHLFDTLAAGQRVILSADVQKVLNDLSAFVQQDFEQFDEVAAPVATSTLLAVVDLAQISQKIRSARAEMHAADANHDFDTDLLEIFLEEAEELLVGIDQDLNTWAKDQTNTASLNNLMRYLHTLKGGANMISAKNIGLITHNLESIYERLINNQFEASPALISVIRLVQDDVSDRIQAIRDEAIDYPATETVNILQNIVVITQGQEVASTELVEAEVQPVIEIEQLQDRTETAVSVETNDLENTLLFQSNETLSFDLSEDLALAENLQQEISNVDFTDSVKTERNAEEQSLHEIAEESFLEEAEELLETTESLIQQWIDDRSNRSVLLQLQRAVHSLKGGARMIELEPVAVISYQLENTLEQFAFHQFNSNAYDNLLFTTVAWLKQAIFKRDYTNFDGLNASLTAIEYVDVTAQLPERIAQVDLIDSTASFEFIQGDGTEPPAMLGEWDDVNQDDNSNEMIRISADLVEKMIDLSGENSINRSRIEMELGQFNGTLYEMEQAIQRLADQLRRMEGELESQILAKHGSENSRYEDFDPLEMDQYSSLNQLSKSLAESTSDLVDFKNTLADKIRGAEGLLLQQSRIQSEIQESLMRTRLVPFSRLLPRLQRLVRQTATTLNRPTDLIVNNTEGELDRTILEKLVSPLEHMLRNAIDHGIEEQDVRQQVQKPETGRIELNISRQGTDVIVEFSDDGKGIDAEIIKAKAIEKGLIQKDQKLSQEDILQYIFHPGFSTAKQVTQISGRGVGLDVVQSEIKSMGGQVTVQSTLGQGSIFTIRVPTTVAVSDALMVKVGDQQFAVPLSQIDRIVRISPVALEEFFDSKEEFFGIDNQSYKLRYLSEFVLNQPAPRLQGIGHSLPVLLIKGSMGQSIALLVDQLVGSRSQIVVKAIGQQFSSIGAISGATIMGDGHVCLILDGQNIARQIQSTQRVKDGIDHRDLNRKRDQRRLVMIVDDSVTVRKVTSRLLERHGFDVITAKDGVDAIEQLESVKPDLMLLDIEMPRMDGFEVTNLVRHHEIHRELPIIMITSRTGEKHRERAFSLGVTNYMGKPFQEAELLENIEDLLTDKREVY